jgi:hypothetical protein
MDTVGLGLLDVLLAGSKFVISARRNCSALRGRCPAAVSRDISRKIDWMLRADCIAYTVARSEVCAYVLVGTPEGAGLCIPSLQRRRSR